MSIRFEQITKRYQGLPVVNDVTLEITAGEFFVLLGPSGSGKSTLLRAVAGLVEVDHGRISLHGRDVTHVRPRDRNVGFVFQHYALFRHMTVAENVEFALRVRRVRAAERRRRRDELLKLVSLDGLAERLPMQLSGGQQQRVAVARALAHEPAVLLLDEPFGALDARIRVELREVVKAVQRRLGTTTILVTHDQEEAFAVADRLGVMHMGRLLESGRPEDLYRRPATRFVATFLGAANLLLGEITPQGLTLGEAVVARHDALRAPHGARSEVVTVVRPEDIEVADMAERLATRRFARGTVRSASFAGQLEQLTVEIEPASGLRSATVSEGARAAGSDVPGVLLGVTRTSTEQRALKLVPGQRIALGVRRLHVLPTPISSFRLLPWSVEDVPLLQRAPLVTRLAESMQAQVTVSDSSLPAGVVVVAADPARLHDVGQLVRQGTRRILAVPRAGDLPTRVIVHCNTEGARPGALGIVASVMRHLPAETTFVSVQDPAAPRSDVTAAYRSLLDARAELQSTHGLDLRTDIQIGDVDGWVSVLAARDEATLVVLGLEGTTSEIARLIETRYRPLFGATSRCAVLIATTDAGALAVDADTIRNLSQEI
jgi:ABC-type Fe3+/spermidine/putrescine transport system ATPase subunit